MQTCTKCLTTKPLTDFPPNKRYKSGRHSWCKPCKASLERASSTPERTERRKRTDTTARLRRHGLTREQHDFMLMVQDWCCAVCKQELPPEPEPHIDHDHRCCPSGKRTCGRCNRGLLCARCNPAIGLLRDDPEILKAAIEYLNSWLDSGMLH